MSQPLETADPDFCKDATEETIQVLGASLDRVERATTPAEIQELTPELTTAFQSAGQLMRIFCGEEKSGPAMSELAVWLSGEAGSRPSVSANFAEAFLAGVCELDVDLSPSARIACAG